MNESKEINDLLVKSNNAFYHESDVNLSKTLRVGALDQAFMNLMIAASDWFSLLMREIFKYPRRNNLAGTNTLFRLSFLPSVYLSIEPNRGGVSFDLYSRWPTFLSMDVNNFACCVIVPEGNKHVLYAPTCKGEPVPYLFSCKDGYYRNMKYFVNHYTHEWLYKNLKAELRKRIFWKNFDTDAIIKSVT